MKINPGNARGLLVPQGDRPFSFVVYSSEIRDFGLSNLIVALRLGELMMVENLTWQAIGTYAVFFGIGGVAIAWGLAKTVKAWKDALK